MNMLKRVIKENDGMGVVEVILIILVLVGLVFIFKTQITNIIKSVFDTISSTVSQL